ncbi:uncharacterized protein B0I36DRAFT_363020 [Microdochium trichocladiopsis]|uniref:SH3 domain-containing protein n=1 Tax=Microdochium trichocladiopsis TaxID=1682393 RepID=A0A9P9BQY3_9PEZI|nr:uncharacterized protein B0I36DRAFT_363020 [Microdochium trichocladiopsis]KAH7031310.1 hypothetical protein B0I36DRAFT_363020 [Microdochium trichocladiopsis]
MAATPFKVKALFEYASTHEDDLPFAVGQIITVVEVEDADWYVGEYVDDSGTKHEGIFPQNFVEKYEPVAPPRPTRTRKKEPEAAAPEALASPPLPPSDAPAPPLPANEPTEAKAVPEPEPVPLESRPVPPPPPAATVAEPEEPRSPQASKPPSLPITEPDSKAQQAPEPEPELPPTTKQPKQTAAVDPVQPPAKAPVAEQRAVPPVAAKSNAFKDRIAAFNKPAAAPVAPFKPSGLGGSGFIKKPFVAPPPSRNAYIPPPQQAPVSKIYRREEDPEIKEREAEALENAEKAGLVPGSSQEADDEDQPKPMSLKERMAMLQKQQAEQAQRHADAVAKKAKPKRPSKPRTDSDGPAQTPPAVAEEDSATPLERRETNDTTSRKSIDSTRRSIDESPLARQPLPNRRKSVRGVENDGNEADMSGAGDTTEGQEDLTERDDSDAASQSLSRVPTVPAPHGSSTVQDKPGPDLARGEPGENHQTGRDSVEEHNAEEEEEEEEVDPEVRRKEELRARMAKMSGGMGMGMMGMHGMLGMAPPPAPPAKKKKAPAPVERRSSEYADDAPTSPRGAPPVPTMMALPGMGKPIAVPEATGDSEDEGVAETTPVPAASPEATASREVTGERPPPPPVPTGSRPPPPPVPIGVKSPSVGSESDDELSESQQKPSVEDAPPSTRAPPPPVPTAAPALPASPREEDFAGDELSPTTPSAPPHPTRRHSKPPPVPGAAPPVPGQARPPPPPPPGHASRLSLGGSEAVPVPMQPGHLDNGEEEEGTAYEGDYDTDIASSAPHKDALKAHAREDSSDGPNAVQSPPSAPPPIPGTAAPRAVPPPVPSQPAPTSRQSVDVPRAAPPPPPPGRGASYSHTDEDYDPFNYNAIQKVQTGLSQTSVSPRLEGVPLFSEPSPFHQAPPPPPPTTRAPPAAPAPSGPPPARGSARQSLDIPRQSMAGRRSVDVPRAAAETGFFANDIDLAEHTKWWLSPNGIPPVFQGRKDILVETHDSTSSGQAGAVSVNKVVKVLFQDYSQTIITVDFDPQDTASGELDQQHEAPPRTLRQDELERAYETYGMQIAQTVSGKKDSVVGDGTPHGLIHELLKAHPEALHPVGTRAFGALVYSNIGNAATQTNDEIRAGDIISIRNARFQGKHGPMHAKYSMEVGKPDHVAVVAEWDGTKKKVKAWEQGRENKKLKQESFRLDDLRSGEVKVWRVMPRSWVGWDNAPN